MQNIIYFFIGLLVIAIVPGIIFGTLVLYNKTIGLKLEPKLKKYNTIVPIIALLFIVVSSFVNYDGLGHIRNVWTHWFPDEEWVKTLCMYPKERGYLQTIGDYKICLKEHNVTVTNIDIRKMCYQQAHDQYLEDKYSNKAENGYYLDCVRSEGLPN